VKFSQFSIRATLLIIISILNILIAVLVGSGVYRSWDNLSRIHDLKTQSAIINMLYICEKHLSIERGIAMAISDAPPEIKADLRADLLKHREAADSGLNAVYRRLRNARDENVLMVMGRVQERYEELRDMRAEVDEGGGQRSGEAFYSRIFDSSTAVIDDIDALILALSRPIMHINTVVSQQLFFKHFIWEITEYAGREYAEIGKLIVRNERPAMEVQERLIAWNSRTELDWETSNQFLIGGGLQDKLQSHIDEAKTHYSVTFDQIKDLFYKTGPEPITLPYPISIELWLDMASQVIDSLMSLKDMALIETEAYIDGLEKEANESIAANLFLFACALALSFYSWWVIVQRVIRPVNTMADSLYRQAHGTHHAITHRKLSEQDEIGKLALVLDVFQENSRRLETLSKDLTQQKNSLEAIFETALDAIISIDEDGLVTEWNRRAEEIFGWPRAEILGKSMVEKIIPPSYRAAHMHGMQRFLADGTSKILNRRIELEAMGKSGNIFPIELAVTALRLDNRYRFIAFISDITDRKKAEEESRHYLKSLEDSNRELDDFAYIASHDLKEPLRGMHNFSQFLLEDYEAKLDEEGKNMLRTIAYLTRRMDELLSSLLHYSRLGRTELSVRETDLNEIARNAIGLHAVRIKESNAEVKILGDLGSIVCDHVRIAEVFQNLIGNALKYNDGGDVKIEIGVTHDHPSNPGAPVYFVRDNGIGIEEKNLESIFKIFRRLHAKDAYGGGTGSGLTIARKIIMQHDGKMWAESPGKGKGTTFFFTIPAPADVALHHA
jgi:PAS domain S-box-containing protein